MIEKFKPLLAVEAEMDKLRFPLLVSPKLDGIRCVIHPELGPVTRSLKPIPNEALRAELAKLPPWLDGELIAGEPNAKDAMQRTSSAVMSRDGSAEGVTFYVFDRVDAEMRFMPRLDCLPVAQGMVDLRGKRPLAIKLPHDEVHTLEELMRVEDDAVKCGFEGLMLRDPLGVYKFGRSTVKEGILLKMKRFSDMEGVVLAFIERAHNTNEQTRDELGRAKRSKVKAGLVGAGTLGAILVGIEGFNSKVVEVGTGWTDEERLYIWHHQAEFQDRVMTFKYQAHGSKDAPRCPVFKCWRKEE